VNARTGYSSAERGLNNIGDHLTSAIYFGKLAQNV
jgi:hypothetical protein